MQCLKNWAILKAKRQPCEEPGMARQVGQRKPASFNGESNVAKLRELRAVLSNANAIHIFCFLQFLHLYMYLIYTLSRLVQQYFKFLKLIIKEP
jgi:hypothetical protein